MSRSEHQLSRDEYLRDLAQDLVTVFLPMRERSVELRKMAADNPYPFNLVVSKLAEQDEAFVEKINSVMVGIIALVGEQ